jgi:uncharacterized repeat protein (TIGR01451 family)
MGEVVVFSIEVTNTGASPAASLQIAAEYDPILSPLRATEGHASLGAQIVWSIPAPPSNDLRLPRTEIAPRETVRYRIEFRPTAASPQACLRVAVKSGTQILAEQEKCVAIRAQAPAGPPPASLSVSVSANREPVTAGAELSYLIRVTNTGQTADSNVTLSVTLPAQLTLVRLRTVGPGGISYSVQGNTVRFQTVPQLGPGMRLDYRVRAQASQAGQAVVRAEVVSQSAAQPVAAEETTTVLPQ